MLKRKQIEILGVPVDRVNMEEARLLFEGLMSKEGCSLIVTPNSEIIYNADKDLELKNILISADLVIPDGIGLIYASKILGSPLQERVTGIDFLNAILDWFNSNGGSIFFLGGKPGIASLAAEKIKLAFPNLRVAGTHHGYFPREDEQDIVNMINSSNADFLCVAMGAPRQEKFIARHKENLGVKAAIGVGGSLDVWAGAVKRAPEFYQRLGLEWLYRLIKQPSRYKRMIALPLFMLKVLRTRIVK
ncbi:MAG: WecB/TagA/CpsF family glycosyltransferase [Clostridiales bacterium]|nr:WecB/TagA/CpsF family glycosyltransferase [Clostridiales bacterium]